MKQISDLQKKYSDLQRTLSDVENSARQEMHALSRQTESAMDAAHKKISQSGSLVEEYHKFVKVKKHLSTWKLRFSRKCSPSEPWSTTSTETNSF